MYDLDSKSNSVSLCLETEYELSLKRLIKKREQIILLALCGAVVNGLVVVSSYIFHFSALLFVNTVFLLTNLFLIHHNSKKRRELQKRI